MSERPPIPRTVKPRKTIDDPRSILAVSQKDGLVLVESGGEVLEVTQLAPLLVAHPPALVVTQDAARLLKRLDAWYGDDPRWQYRVTPVKRTAWKPNRQGRTRTVTGTVVNFFGWQKVSGKGKPKQASHYHFMLDPLMFSRMTIGELIDGDDPEVVKLLRWGQDVRDWMVSQGLKATPSNGGVGGQLLKDARFFPEARRKVPKRTNARARHALPGNFYRLYCEENRGHQALYLDMTSAHHNIARTLTFPDPDTLKARGRFRTIGTDGTAHRWATPGTPIFARMMASHGLLLAQVTAPSEPRGGFTLPYLETPGQRSVFIHTNELAFILSTGATVDWIIAGWTSWDVATGLNRYADYALQQSQEADAARKRWLKPTMLATYGVLATRPRISEFGYKRAQGGVPKSYPAGSGQLQVQAMIGETESEVPTVNVIYRGLIEAEQRIQALTLARDLTAHGARILAIYADSVFVESPCQLPLLPHPWRVEAQLDRLRFFNSTSFYSHQVTKLPGISRANGDRIRRLEQMQRR